MARLTRYRTSLFATVVFGGAAVLASDSADAEPLACGDCHQEKIAAASIHAELACGDCHSDIKDVPHGDERLRGDAVCAQCHDVGKALAASVHAEVAGCSDCHGAPHAILAVDASDSPVQGRQQPDTCGACHEGDLIRAFRSSIHGHALLVAGLTVAPSCSGCHGSHSIAHVADDASTVSAHEQPKTCGSCHRFIVETWLEGAHGRAWSRGLTQANGMSVPTCATCHSSHSIRVPRERAARLASAEVCGHCHTGRYSSYRDGFHGQASSVGFVQAAVCADCHGPHANLPASDPHSTIHPDHLRATCGVCHGQVPAGFVSFDPHSDPSDPEGNPVVHWIYVLMSGLLLGVFGFFALHSALWLQRTVVAWHRGELERHVTRDGPWVRRFAPAHRATHVVVIVTFLLLASTGLPLKFHHTAWADWVVAVFGGYDAAHALHRLAAVGTLGYVVFHLYYLGRRLFRDHDLGILLGWTSMVPGPSDLTDLYSNLRYFFYLGPKPKLGRWTYWEKFDYFAVFWGIPVIGLSGLMLWLPTLFTSWLPGWALNVAFVVHSDEALLATGFIFIFHFFHTHLRPESFPLDQVVFVGSMPLSRFKDERAREYERLVSRGELERYLVDAPSPEALARARVFGFVALTIGLALAVGILASLAGA